LLQDLQSFGLQLLGEKGEPCHVAPRLREARHETARHGISSESHDNGNRCTGLLHRQDRWRAGRHDDVRLETDQLSREDWESLLVPLRPAVGDDEILPLHVPELTEAFTECRDMRGLK
jgi:hypothetical protein